ncbi:MAG: delta-60 repeat domain-containing protein [Verrucomicrobia bacterium]|nr:delta-60 repeat domain-containing protein [Verrucomicrobiota bacterium]
MTAVNRNQADFYDVVVTDGASSLESAKVQLMVRPVAYPNSVRYDAASSWTVEDANSAAGPGGSRAAGIVRTIVAAPAGGVYVGGRFTHINGVARNGVARINADGTVDSAFNPNVTGALDSAGIFTSVITLVVQGDGKILVGGIFDHVGGAPHNNIARLNADGSIDATFTASASGNVALVEAMAVQFDRKIVVGGFFKTINGTACQGLARLNADGTLDSSFNLPVDATFTGWEVEALTVQPDGKVLVGGIFATIGGVPRSNLARLKPDGSVDADFAPVTPVPARVAAMALRPDGKIVVATLAGLMGFNADGTADAGFAPASADAHALVVQEDGQLWVGGGFAEQAGVPLTARIRKLGPDGLTDGNATFDPVIPGYTSVNALCLDDAGRLWAGGGPETRSLARLVSVLAPSPGARVMNLSVRSNAGTAEQTLIVGFVISGAGNKTLLLRGAGPLIASLGVSDALADPKLRLLGADGTEIEANNDWDGALATTFASLGATAFAPGSKDAAIYHSVPAGVYSAHIVPSDSVTGVALAEIYDGDANQVSAKLINISARSQVGNGDGILIAGFVITDGAKTLLIRGKGPSLPGVSGVLADPQLALYQGNTLIANNDNWGGTAELKSAFSLVGADALAADTSKDAALLVTLPSGAYSVHVSGVGGTKGVGLIEIFVLP